MYIKFCNNIEKTINVVLAAIIGILVVIMTAGVVFRYILGDSLIWAEQVNRMLFVWSTFLGSAILYRKGLHISLDFVLKKLNKTIRNIITLLNETLLLILFVFLVIFGTTFSIDNISQTTGALNLSPSFYYFAVPVSSLAMVLFWIERIVVLKVWKTESNNEKDSFEDQDGQLTSVN